MSWQMKKRMSGMSYKYTGVIFKIPFPFTDLSSSKARPAMALSEPDEYGDIAFVFITTKQTRKVKFILDIPKGLLPFESHLHLDKVFLLNRDIILKEIVRVEADFLEQVLKNITLIDTQRYFENIHKPLQNRPFVPGKSRINYAGRVFDASEMMNLVDATLEFYLTAGRYDREFCEKLSAYLNTSDMPDVKSITVNSGSSANLLAIGSLTSPKLGELKLSEGDEVITVAAGFPTSIAPIVQNSLVPVFVDVELGSYNIDSGKIEEAISEKTKAVFLAHTLGMPFDLDEILELAEKYRLWVIEDNCDALGAEYTLKREYNLIRGKKVSGRGKTGTIGHIGTSSFYPAHQITMGEGGAVYTSDIDLYRIAKSLRDWGRDCWCEPGCDNTCGKRFKQQLGKLPFGYDHKYTYSHIGYNLKITDMQAAIGAAQMDKVSTFAGKRLENWKRLKKGVNDLEDVFILPAYPENSIPSPFGFALTVRDNAKFTREDITSFLEKNNIQTRAVFAGNMLRQPAFADAKIKLRIGNSPILISNNLTDEQYSRLPNTEIIMHRTFWVGVYPGMTEWMVDFMIEKIIEAQS
jgi:CDP-6-deoxy-D-xylo-4-hexulose-3-dehydrase